MSSLHLIRLPVRAPSLMQFAFEQGITQEDETFGYTLHAWLAALFGPHAPKPFRYFERRGEVLAYADRDANALLAQAQAFASPQAWTALHAEGLASKPMPEAWRTGQRLRLEALVCPVSRKDSEEKDVYRRVLERAGEGAPAPGRAEVYRQWFVRQLGGAVRVQSLDLLGMRARVKMLRRAREGTNRLRTIERPHALLAAEVSVADSGRFSAMLARGIGRHRSFGFGMLLLAPPHDPERR